MRRIVLALVLMLPPAAVGAAESGPGSLPSVAIGPRPGPPVLYEPLATSPVLENTGAWQADPLMVSGADAYAGGEYLYQDYVYDSFGANTTDGTLTQPETVPNSSDTLFGGMTGDLTYPTDVARYGNDAADLLEFRARLTGDGAIAYRVTLNTMLAPDAAIVAIGRAYTAAPGSSDWGYGLGELGARVDDVVVTWGTGLGGAATSTAHDVARNQIEVSAPLPDGATEIAHYLVVGIHDGSGGFAAVGDQPTGTAPGGANGRDVPPVLNVGFRFEAEGDEPMGGAGLTQDPLNAVEFGARGAGFGHWREHGQAKALAARDISSFVSTIEVQKLAAAVDESHVPASGYMNRLYVSHLDLGEGLRVTRPVMVGEIQPYAVYVPTTYEPGERAPLHLHLHSLSGSYNQYGAFSPNLFQEIGEERGAFVLSPGGRGPDGWWHDEAEVDAFEAWADLAARYDLDPDRTSVGGYSMGGYGTYRLSSLYPDLFAKGFAIVGPADEDITGGPTGEGAAHNSLRVIENIYNVPLWMWNGIADELVPVAGVVRFANRLAELGYRHELDLFPADHFLLSVVDEWDRARDLHLADVHVDRDPERVVYRVARGMGAPALGLVHDHAYWVSDLEISGDLDSGRIDAWSGADGFQVFEPVPEAGPGVDHVLPHARRGVRWDPVGSTGPSNELRVDLQGLSAATVWLERAGLTPEGLGISVTADAPGTLTVAGTFGSVQIAYAPGTQMLTPFA